MTDDLRRGRDRAIEGILLTEFGQNVDSEQFAVGLTQRLTGGRRRAARFRVVWALAAAVVVTVALKTLFLPEKEGRPGDFFRAAETPITVAIRHVDLRLDPNTEAAYVRDVTTSSAHVIPVIQLRRGALFCNVEPDHGGLLLETTVGRVVVKGTQFRVMLEEEDGKMGIKTMVVKVIVGAVLVTGAWGESELSAGESKSFVEKKAVEGARKGAEEVVDSAAEKVANKGTKATGDSDREDGVRNTATEWFRTFNRGDTDSVLRLSGYPFVWRKSKWVITNEKQMKENVAKVASHTPKQEFKDIQAQIVTDQKEIEKAFRKWDIKSFFAVIKAADLDSEEKIGNTGLPSDARVVLLNVEGMPSRFVVVVRGEGPYRVVGCCNHQGDVQENVNGSSRPEQNSTGRKTEVF